MKVVKVFNKTKDTLTVECFTDDGIVFEEVPSGYEKIVGVYDVRNNKYYVSMRKRGFKVDFVDDKVFNNEPLTLSNTQDVLPELNTIDVKAKDLIETISSEDLANVVESIKDLKTESETEIVPAVEVIETDDSTSTANNDFTLFNDSRTTVTLDAETIETENVEEKPKAKRGRRKKSETAE